MFVDLSCVNFSLEDCVVGDNVIVKADSKMAKGAKIETDACSSPDTNSP